VPWQTMEIEMKTLIAALALLMLAAGTVFAQSYISQQDESYYPLTPADPSWAGQGPGWDHR
jgi:hypothetical protein